MNKSSEVFSADADSKLFTKLHYTQFIADDSGVASYFKTQKDVDPLEKQNALYCTGGVMKKELSYYDAFLLPDEHLAMANEEAKEFVRTTVGPVSDGDLLIIPENDPTGANGFCSTVLGTVATRNLENIACATREYYLASHLVHEQAHSTAIRTSKIISIALAQHDEQTSWNNYIFGVSFGMGKVKIAHDHADGKIDIVKKGVFLEEAFAEETASRYRATLYGGPEEMDSILCQDNTYRDIPRRYLSRNEEDLNDIVYINYSAFPAYLMHRLSEYSGMDIYELMVLSRDPEYEVEAKRAIVQALEGIEKGLYKTLRDLPYPDLTPDFFQTYDELLALTERDTVSLSSLAA